MFSSSHRSDPVTEKGVVLDGVDGGRDAFCYFLEHLVMVPAVADLSQGYLANAEDMYLNNV